MKNHQLIGLYQFNRVLSFFYNHRFICIAGLFILTYILLVKWFLSGYLITDYTLFSALLLSPYIIQPNITKKGNRKYLWLSIPFLILAYCTGVKTFLFLSICFSILFLLECTLGYIGYLPFFLVGLLSPTFKYFNNMLGFPVRLKLSEWVGNILQFAGYKVEISGNVLIMNGTEFSVDPGCVGLKMIAISLLAGILMIAYFQKQRNKPFPFHIISLILLVIVSFNVISNLIRIILLTLFNILPENPGHDIAGILCFIIYIIIPSYFVINWFSNKSNKNNLKVQKGSRIIGYKIILLNLFLLMSITITGETRLNQRKTGSVSSQSIPTSGYVKEFLKEDIVKLVKPGILIYIKPMQSFYGAEHNPMICWLGSGYQFSRIKRQQIFGKEIYTGLLKKGGDIIYTAWWFDSGSYQTNSQIDWRIKALNGENFYLINVNSGNEYTLMKEIKLLLRT